MFLLLWILQAFLLLLNSSKQKYPDIVDDDKNALGENLFYKRKQVLGSQEEEQVLEPEVLISAKSLRNLPNSVKFG